MAFNYSFNCSNNKRFTLTLHTFLWHDVLHYIKSTKCVLSSRDCSTKKVFNTENYTGLDVKLKRSQAPVIVECRLVSVTRLYLSEMMYF